MSTIVRSIPRHAARRARLGGRSHGRKTEMSVGGRKIGDIAEVLPLA